MDDLYHQLVLDHYKNPRHFGPTQSAEQIIAETNASCGDSFTFYINFNTSKTHIQSLTFKGEGCAISTAACSLLAEKLQNQPLTLIHQLNLSYMQHLLGDITITPARQKCLMLPAQALRKLQP